MIEIKVNKIRSYQTLVYKNGYKTFQTKEYKEYQKEIEPQLLSLNKIGDLREIKLIVNFKCQNKVVGDLDNIFKPIADLLQKNGYIVNDKQITDLHITKTFNHKENSIELEIIDKG